MASRGEGVEGLLEVYDAYDHSLCLTPAVRQVLLTALCP